MMALCVTPKIPNVQTWTGLNQERPYFACFSTVSYCFGKVTSSSWTQISNEESELSQRHVSRTQIYINWKCLTPRWQTQTTPDPLWSSDSRNHLKILKNIHESNTNKTQPGEATTDMNTFIPKGSLTNLVLSFYLCLGFVSNDCCRTRQRTSLTHLSKEKLQESITEAVSQYRSNLRKL